MASRSGDAEKQLPGLPAAEGSDVFFLYSFAPRRAREIRRRREKETSRLKATKFFPLRYFELPPQTRGS
jgi:hypothetical protein